MIFKLQLVLLKICIWTGARRQLTKITPCDYLLLPLCYQAIPKPVGRITKTSFPRAKFTRQVFCSFFSAPMCWKSRKHSFNTEVIVDSSISSAWTSHAISLSDRNNPLWERWYNLSNLTNQRVYQELVYRNGSFKEMITGSAAPALPSFLPFYFRVCAFSIQRTRLSRSLEQASFSGFLALNCRPVFAGKVLICHLSDREKGNVLLSI